MENDFWQYHGWGFIFCMCFFPRLTMLFATTYGGEGSAGLIYWISWLVCPRISVAFIATYLFGHSNTTLVMFAWIWAFSFEEEEKKLFKEILK